MFQIWKLLKISTIIHPHGFIEEYIIGSSYNGESLLGSEISENSQDDLGDKSQLWYENEEDASAASDSGQVEEEKIPPFPVIQGPPTPHLPEGISDPGSRP